MLADQMKSRKVGVDSKRFAPAEGDPFLTSIDSLRFNDRRHSTLVAVRAIKIGVIGSSSPSSYDYDPS
jgi:hypothetical protein